MERIRESLRGEEFGALRALGGLLLATGLLVVLSRRTSVPDPWGSGVIFFFLAGLSGFLYAAGFLGARGAERSLPWHAIFITFGVALMPLALFSFLDWVDGDANAPLNSVWIFGVTAAAGFFGAVIAGVRAAALLGALSLIIVWLAFWSEVIDDGVLSDIGTFRGLLVLIALILLGAAAWLSAREDVPEGAPGDVVSAAGIAAIAAGAISLGQLAGGFVSFVTPAVEPSFLWDAELIIVSVALIAYGTFAAVRGPVYIGAFGLFAFIYVVGVDLGDDGPSGSLLWWPLFLVVVGAGLLAASVLPALRRSD